MELFDGKYKTTEVLGKGGMGTVYLAENISLGTKWAIKQVKKNIQVQYDFLAEPNILKRLNHPLLPRIVDIGEDEDNLYIVMDYIEGDGLNRILAEHRPVEEEQALIWFRDLCDILLYLHNQKPRPIIYRDMKPSNIIITPEGRAKVIDFGISREYKAGKQQDTRFMGTHGYAPPEQWGIGQTDRRTDIYSLGVTVYQMLTGKSPNEPPYEFRPVRELNPKLSEGIEHIVNKCVQTEPVNRYQSVEELLQDLDNIHTLSSEYKRKRRARSIILAVEAALAAVGCGVMVVSALHIPEEQDMVYNNMVDEGYIALDSLDYEGAMDSFALAQSFKPGYAEGYLGKADVLWNKGDVDASLAYMEEILEANPEFYNDARFNYIIASLLYDKGEYAQAQPYLENAVALDPENPDYIRDLAVVYGKNGDMERANEYLDLLDAYDSGVDVSSFVSGQFSQLKGDFSEAEAFYRQAVEDTEDESLKFRCYKALSDLFLELRHSNPDNYDYIKKQIDVLEQAQKDLKNKNNLVIIEALGEAYYAGKRWDAAIMQFSALIDAGYYRDYIYRNIAIVYQNKGDYDNAGRYLEEMLERFPDSYLAYAQLAYLTIEREGTKPMEERDYTPVQEYYNRVVELAPEGASQVDALQLSAYIQELKNKGWL